MDFSIVIPVYNVESYLKECIESILSQTYKNYEIILVDDGSTDNSPKICDDYEEKYQNILVIHNKNRGASSARNTGTKKAVGKYIIYMDSDDFILDKEFLRKLAKKIENETDIIFYKYQKYFNKIKKLEECKFSYSLAIKENSYANKIAALVKENAFFGMAWIRATRKEIILKNKIEFEEGLVGEDMDWNYHVILNSSSIDFIDEPMIAYRQREGSVTSNYKLKNLLDFVYILEKWSEYIKKEVKDENLKKAFYGSLAKYYSNLLIVYSRILDLEKKDCINRIKRLSWLLDYGMSCRPQVVSKIYKIIGFNFTIKVLKIIDRIR